MTSHPVPRAFLLRLPHRSRFRFDLMACSKRHSGQAARLYLLSHLFCSSSASPNPLSLLALLKLPALKHGVSPLWCGVYFRGYLLVTGKMAYVFCRKLYSAGKGVGCFLWKSFTFGVGSFVYHDQLSGYGEKVGRIIKSCLIH